MNKTETLAVNTIRILSAEAVEKAKSGHPGLPMGAAAAAFELFFRHMKHNPKTPGWRNRDRFILSAGHGSMLLYSLLHLFGYDLPMEELCRFRQFGSLTPGHPEYRHTPGVEMTTGPLGQGIATAVGMAMAEAHLAARFNREGYPVVDHFTYALVGDGCMMEGVQGEAASLAGTLKLGKLIVLYDKNNISIEGDTDIAFTEDVGKRYEAYGWHVETVENGNDVGAAREAIERAKACTDRPSLIIVRTEIAHGSPVAGLAKAHGEPLGAENIQKTKEFFGLGDAPPLTVPGEVYDYMKEWQNTAAEAEDDWNRLFGSYRSAHPELAAEFDACFVDTPPDLENDGDFWRFEKASATRATSGDVLNRVNRKLPNLFGGSADLAPSNKSELIGESWFSPEDRTGKNIHFGVREFAMACCANGIALHGGLRPFCATFLVFSDYLKGAVRLSALMELPVLYLLTHDSIGVGEDGPTHEPVEHVSALRLTPGVTVFRPADGTETAAGYLAALRASGPTCMILSRQNLPNYEETSKDAIKGGYILKDTPSPDIILMASGSEVELVVKAADELAAAGISCRVVSMPSMELFEAQPDAYRESVLPSSVRARVAVEAGASASWYRYTGLDGAVVGLDRFGASAPAAELFEHFGFTVDNVVKTAKRVLGK
ncbi:transketolase [Oscillospiraceae bacterium OttesenSCG-928-G22]|nr:transketolase [Oscillospiraceae bacterium OttesenSCG-928-G22]